MSLKLINGTSLLMVGNLLGVTAGGVHFAMSDHSLLIRIRQCGHSSTGKVIGQVKPFLCLFWSCELYSLHFNFEAVDVEFYVSAAVMYKSDQFNPSTHPLTPQGTPVIIIAVRYMAAVIISGNKIGCNSYHQRKCNIVLGSERLSFCVSFFGLQQTDLPSFQRFRKLYSWLARKHPLIVLLHCVES